LRVRPYTRVLRAFPTRRSSDLGDLGLGYVLRARAAEQELVILRALPVHAQDADVAGVMVAAGVDAARYLDLQLAQIVLQSGIGRSEEHTSELQSRENLVCRRLL